MDNKEQTKKKTKVKAVSDRETVIVDDQSTHNDVERQINSDEITHLRDQSLALEVLVEHIVGNAIRRQKDAGEDSLTIDVTFDLLEKSIIVTDNSVGLTLEDFSSLVLETRFGTMIENVKPKYDENLSLLELAAYFGNNFELVSVSKNLTKWVSIDFNDVLNLEQVDMKTNKNEENKRMVKKIIPVTGVRYTISDVAVEYETGRSTYPTNPNKFHKLRVHLRDTFADVMEEMDLVINLGFRAKITKKKKKFQWKKN